MGGNLHVSFDENEGKYTNVFLKGPAEFVFKGDIEIELLHKSTIKEHRKKIHLF